MDAGIIAECHKVVTLLLYLAEDLNVKLAVKRFKRLEVTLNPVFHAYRHHNMHRFVSKQFFVEVKFLILVTEAFFLVC